MNLVQLIPTNLFPKAVQFRSQSSQDKCCGQSLETKRIFAVEGKPLDATRTTVITPFLACAAGRNE